MFAVVFDVWCSTRGVRCIMFDVWRPIRLRVSGFLDCLRTFAIFSSGGETSAVLARGSLCVPFRTGRHHKDKTCGHLIQVTDADFAGQYIVRGCWPGLCKV